MGHLIVFGIIFIISLIIALLWVRGIDSMKNNHPNYKGDDLFGPFDNEDEKHIG